MAVTPERRMAVTAPNFFDIETYDYNLPQELIAQRPAIPRDHCRLMGIRRDNGSIVHQRFYDVLQWFRPGDLLVRNDTRVMASRLEGVKATGSAKVEILLLKAMDDQELHWEALVKPGRKLPEGTSVDLNCGVTVLVGAPLSDDGVREIIFPHGCNVRQYAEQEGEVPLPPYIKDRTSSPEDYQTVYSREAKSSAAPTAGLHFTCELLDRLRQLGVQIADVTLEVGLGTFRPVKVQDIREHRIHRESCHISQETYNAILSTKSKGGRVIALGTTVVRTLEGVASSHGGFRAGSLETGIYIYPGYEYKLVDGLITNFHLPKSTLLMLVAAFAGYDLIMKAYQEAIAQRYRFFSFGDGMIIL